ncbi:MAG: prepilin-type N-terminal cleavage/methylation domain-containing protein [bacterium]|nr:prepilin-type N-terminal cleavage/methylation domain-containing protein [bacterium]
MRNKGFTLIELLVVIAIIGVLSSVVLASLNSARVKSRVAAAQTSLKSFSGALAICLGDSIAITPDSGVAPTAGGAACTDGGTAYTWPALPAVGTWSYTTAWTTTLGESFSFVATGDSKTITCTENGCTTT